MPTIATVDGIKIQVFADHHPPHFHAVAAEFQIAINLATLEVIAGALPKKDLKKVLAWAAANRQEIENAWTQING